MFNLTTNVANVLQQEIARLRQHEMQQGPMLDEAARIGRDAVADRIQQQGLNTAGQRMESPSVRKKGAYSSGWGTQRANRGLQTGHVDFTFNNRLMPGWSVLTQTGSRAAIGFASDDLAQQADELEKRFGYAFDMTPGEMQQGTDHLIKRSDQILL